MIKYSDGAQNETSLARSVQKLMSDDVTLTSHVTFSEHMHTFSFMNDSMAM